MGKTDELGGVGRNGPAMALGVLSLVQGLFLAAMATRVFAVVPRIFNDAELALGAEAVGADRMRAFYTWMLGYGLFGLALAAAGTGLLLRKPWARGLLLTLASLALVSWGVRGLALLLSPGSIAEKGPDAPGPFEPFYWIVVIVMLTSRHTRGLFAGRPRLPLQPPQPVAVPIA